MKNGISSEVFIYILGMIVIGIIVIFGYQKIASLAQAEQKVEIPRFQKQLESLVKSAMGSGNLIKEDVVLPRGFGEICVVDLDKSASSSLQTTKPIIHDSWSDKVQKNVFLVGKTTESFFIDKIKPLDATNNFVCIPLTDGKAKLKFEGKGGYTLVEENT